MTGQRIIKLIWPSAFKNKEKYKLKGLLVGRKIVNN